MDIIECSVCYNKCNKGYVITNCSHTFCLNCLFKWYNHSNSCPICRQIIFENNISDDDELFSIFTGDSDDGRFDTIDNYLEDEYNWSGVIEEDDSQIDTIQTEVLQQFQGIRQDIINVLRYNIYKECTLLNYEFHGDIIQKLVNRNEYSSRPNYIDDNSYPTIFDNIPSKNIYEIVMKNTDDITNEIHHFCRIKGKKMVNNLFVQTYNDGTSYERYSLEYALVVNLISTEYSTLSNNNEFITIKENMNIMFKDIRRIYEIYPILHLN